MAIGLHLGHREFRSTLATYVAEMIRRVRQLDPEGTTTRQDLLLALLAQLGNDDLLRDLSGYMDRIALRSWRSTTLKEGSAAVPDRASHLGWGPGDVQVLKVN